MGGEGIEWLIQRCEIRVGERGGEGAVASNLIDITPLTGVNNNTQWLERVSCDEGFTYLIILQRFKSDKQTVN